jgi:hypothetical protein
MATNRMAMVDIWTYRDQSWMTTQLTGYSVEALDGGIGKIDEASYDVGAGYIVVDTGPWIFGKKVLLPAGVIDRVDHDDERVFVNRTKDQIKSAPEFDSDTFKDESYRGQIGSYYGEGGPGWRAGSTTPDRDR